MASSLSGKKIRVCIIGAGAAGLCAARHISCDLSAFETAIFEQTGTIGGTWVYNDNIGVDDNGYPIHSSMYKNLRTNIPLKLMNFPDFQIMNQKQPSCGTHTQVLEYLNNYAHHFELFQYIQFNTRVESVEPLTNYKNWRLTTWKVKVKHLKTQIVEDQIFDAVMVCHGHYSSPRIPTICGIETFNGDTIHSHDYRRPQQYERKIVIVLGAGPSGIDIAIEVSNYAEHVYLSHNTSRLTSILPSNLTQVQGVESVNGNNFTLKDGTIINANALLICTGYNFTFSFLSDECKIKVNGNHVTPLYEHLINIEHPKMAIIGIPSAVIPFPLFHYQVQFFLALLLNQVSLPPKENMIVQSQTNIKKHPHKLAEHQWEYNDNLANIIGIEKLPPFYKNGYDKLSAIRSSNILQYKNSKIVIADDGETVDITI